MFYLQNGGRRRFLASTLMVMFDLGKEGCFPDKEYGSVVTESIIMEPTIPAVKTSRQKLL